MSYSPQLTNVDRARRAEKVARRYAESGLPAEAVAREFGISRGWVSHIASLYGVSRPRGRRWPRGGA